MSTDRALNNRDGAWQGAITSLDLIKPETVLAIRSGDASTIRSLDAREIRFVCAFALTALGEAHYLRSEALRAQAVPKEPFGGELEN